MMTKALGEINWHSIKQPTNNYLKRSRIWKSVRVLDILVSSILSRPSASLQMGGEQSSGNIYDCSGEGCRLAVNANFGACSVIHDIIQDSGQKMNVDIASAHHLLEQLSQWSASLPNELRQFSSKTPLGSCEQELVVGNIHIACVYYFGVMLVTRSFLITHLMTRLPNKSGDKPSPSQTTEQSLEIPRLAQVCIDSAIYMAQTCQDAMSAGLLLNNMCMLK